MGIVTGTQVIQWVTAHGECFAPTEGATGLGLERNGEVVVGVLYEEYTQASIHATIVIATGAMLTRDFIWAMFDYPFQQLGVEKIIVQMSSANKASENLAQHLGFTLEACISDAYMDGDRLVYTMTKDNCKWLKRLGHEESKDPQGA